MCSYMEALDSDSSANVTSFTQNLVMSWVFHKDFMWLRCGLCWEVFHLPLLLHHLGHPSSKSPFMVWVTCFISSINKAELDEVNSKSPKRCLRGRSYLVFIFFVLISKPLSGRLNCFFLYIFITPSSSSSQRHRNFCKILDYTVQNINSSLLDFAALSLAHFTFNPLNVWTYSINLLHKTFQLYGQQEIWYFPFLRSQTAQQ